MTITYFQKKLSVTDGHFQGLRPGKHPPCLDQLRPPGPWIRLVRAGSSWPGGLGVPPPKRPVRGPLLLTWPSWVLPTSGLQEVGKRPGLEVEGLKRRPPSVGARPRP